MTDAIKSELIYKLFKLCDLIFMSINTVCIRPRQNQREFWRLILAWTCSRKKQLLETVGSRHEMSEVNKIWPEYLHHKVYFFWQDWCKHCAWLKHLYTTYLYQTLLLYSILFTDLKMHLNLETKMLLTYQYMLTERLKSMKED